MSYDPFAPALWEVQRMAWDGGVLELTVPLVIGPCDEAEALATVDVLLKGRLCGSGEDWRMVGVNRP